MINFQMGVLMLVIAFTGMGICHRLERIAKAIEAKLKEKNT